MLKCPYEVRVRNEASLYSNTSYSTRSVVATPIKDYQVNFSLAIKLDAYI